MANRPIFEWIALGIIAVLVVLVSIPGIPIAHFWDEAWVYAPALRTMAQDGVSLLPNALPLDLGRGHPLLFQFLGGVWLSFFGDSNISIHLFALSISLAVLCATYRLVRLVAPAWAAVLAVAFLAAQPMFLAQATMVYPEMLLAFGVLTAFYGYLAGKSWWFVVGIGVAIYAKESAVVFLLAFLIWDTVRIVLFRDANWRSLLKYSIPVVVFASHPLLCYAVYGWFFYPEHTGYLTFDFAQIKWNIQHVFATLFEHQNRGWLVYPLLGLAVFSIRLRHWGWNVLIVALGFATYKVFEGRWFVPDALYIPVLLVGIAAPFLVWWFARSERRTYTSLHHLVAVTFLAIIGFVVFSSMNFFTGRYLLATLVLLCPIALVLVWRVQQLPEVAKWAIALIAIGVSGYGVFSERTVSELNLGYRDDVQLQQQLAEWLTHSESGTRSVCGNFVTLNYLSNAKSGYVTEETALELDFVDVCGANCNRQLLLFTATGGNCRDGVLDSLIQTGAFRIAFDQTLGAASATALQRLD